MMQTKTNTWYQWWDTFQWWNKSGQWWDICPTIQAVKICPGVMANLRRLLQLVIYVVTLSNCIITIIVYNTIQPNFDIALLTGSLEVHVHASVAHMQWHFRAIVCEELAQGPYPDSKNLGQ